MQFNYKLCNRPRFENWIKFFTYGSSQRFTLADSWAGVFEPTQTLVNNDGANIKGEYCARDDYF